MDNFCSSPIWDGNITWYTNSPDFTDCFQNTVLIWIPSVFILLFMPYELWCQSKSRYLQIPWSNLNQSKLLFITILIAISLTNIIYNFVYFGGSQYLSHTVGNIVLLLTYIIVFYLVANGRIKGIQSSGSIFFFWLFQACCSFITYWSMMNRTLYSVQNVEICHLITHIASFPIIILQLFLASWADHTPQVNLDQKYIKKNKCPEDEVSFLSQFLFCWFTPMVYKGYKEPFVESDQWSLIPKRQCEILAEKFINNLSMQDKKTHGLKTDQNELKNLSIVVPLMRIYWPNFLVAFLCKFMADLLMFVGPLVLNWIITFMTSDEPFWHGIFYVALLFVSSEMMSLFISQYFLEMHITAMNIKTAIIAAVYNKALRLSNEERKKSTVGEIVNLMSVDTQRFLDLLPMINIIWSAPFQICLAIYSIWLVLGPSVFAGLAVMVLMVPINGILAKKSHSLQVLNMGIKDTRTKIMNEIFNGMKVLKLYAWEVPFIKQVLQIRDEEVKQLRTMSYLNATSFFMWISASFMVSIVSFTTYIFIDSKNVLTPNVAFVSLSLFNLLKFPLIMLPHIAAYLIQTFVSIDRLNKFLSGEELDLTAVSHDKNEKADITIKDGNFMWGKSDDGPVLQGINLDVTPGSLVAVVGRVGAGKSSLIAAILGELHKKSGYVNTKGNIAYIPQTAWIRNATIKDNIVMYNGFNRKKYEQILDACGLRSDLEIFPGGDMTEIGEKGINLSGGQKQRISLARAVYHDADIYLLDDPLSAVDSHVGKHIYDNVIGAKGVLKNKTRLMVTHGLSYLSFTDSIVAIDGGIITDTGSYKELMAKNGSFSEIIAQCVLENTEKVDSETETEQLTVSDRARNYQRSISQKTVTSDDQSSVNIRNTDKAKLTDIEEVDTGSVHWKIYYSYLKTMGLRLVALFLCAWVLSCVSFSGANLWLSAWSTDPVLPNNTIDTDLRDLRLGVYGFLGLSQACFVLIASCGFAYCIIKASTVLHQNMLSNVMHTPMSFFDTTPLGRILNRFSKDINVLDINIYWSINDIVETSFSVFLSVIIICIELPVFIAVIIPLSAIYYYVQKVYIASSRQLKRLESKTRSPIYNHFSESLSGVISVRGYKLENKFIDQNNFIVDKNQECYFPSVIANRWLTVRIEFLANLVVLFTALFAILSKGTLDAGSVGLAITYSLSITQELNWMVRSSSELETNMVSSERVIEYSNLNEEASWDDGSFEPQADWPQHGKIEFDSYCTRYRPGLDLVLKDITCVIRPLEKIGICGRTGAGKSSLTLALFRIIESAGGLIKIDGVDISSLALHKLRSKLTIIPQDPVLFSGTLKRNLDPFENYTDAEIWASLENAHLKSYVQSLKNTLDYEVSEGGDNLSVGQRQLICLARALLRKTKILVLDEATAAIDLETDDLIQSTIRREFKDCTIITIAHRLNTIMDNSRVLVLSEGMIAEFDTPTNLLQNSHSIFYGMAKDAGLVA